MDDFLFDIATSDLEVCKIIIELSLGITKKIKSNKQIGVTYMKMEERDRLLRVEGEEKKLIDMVCKKLKKGKAYSL